MGGVGQMGGMRRVGRVWQMAEMGGVGQMRILLYLYCPVMYGLVVFLSPPVSSVVG